MIVKLSVPITTAAGLTEELDVRDMVAGDLRGVKIDFKVTEEGYGIKVLGDDLLTVVARLAGLSGGNAGPVCKLSGPDFLIIAGRVMDFFGASPATV